MSVVKFSEMPDTARVWIYGSARALSEAEAVLLGDHLAHFIEQWTAHKRELAVAWELRHRQFVFIAVDERMMGASGCSIDSMVRNLSDLGQKMKTDMAGTHLKVFFRAQDGEIQCVDRTEFKQLVRNEQMNEQTIVFDNTVQTVGEIRAGKWEVPFKNSWHFEVFGRALV